MLACVFHKQCNQWLMWVSVYINPQNNLAQAERRRKTKACICFLSSHFFPRLLPMHGECQRASERPGRRNKCNPETVAVISGGVPPGVNQSIFWRRGRWIFSSHSPRCDVIVYYPAACVGKREWAVGFRGRHTVANLLTVCPRSSSACGGVCFSCPRVFLLFVLLACRVWPFTGRYCWFAAWGFEYMQLLAPGKLR